MIHQNFKPEFVYTLRSALTFKFKLILIFLAYVISSFINDDVYYCRMSSLTVSFSGIIPLMLKNMNPPLPTPTAASFSSQADRWVAHSSQLVSFVCLDSVRSTLMSIHFFSFTFLNLSHSNCLRGNDIQKLHYFRLSLTFLLFLFKKNKYICIYI